MRRENTHVIIGSSESITLTFRKVLKRYQGATFWTCNGGYALFVAQGTRPDHYMLSDQKAKDLFRCYREDWEKRGKTMTEVPVLNVRLSGMVMIHLAIGMGADQIVLAGLDGYGYEPAYFDGRIGGQGPFGAMDQWVPWIRKRVRDNSHIRWHYYGCPTYRVREPNWFEHKPVRPVKWEHERIVRKMTEEDN